MDATVQLMGSIKGYGRVCSFGLPNSITRVVIYFSWTESVTNAIWVYVEKEHSICQLTRTLSTGFYSPLVRYFCIAKNEDGPL